MISARVFDQHIARYEEWFDINRYVYESELRAVKAQLPKDGFGLEIGVGSGRFAAPLGIKIGVDPSREMRALARERGIEAVGGAAEHLPFEDTRFDFALMVTTICFLDDVERALKEVHRVLRPGGELIVGFVDMKSNLGTLYREEKTENVFYRMATFYSVNGVVTHMKEADFSNFTFVQTIFHYLDEIVSVEPIKPGHGRGAFVVVKGEK